jgi:four helix bundle protein
MLRDTSAWMQDYERLDVWRSAHSIAVEVYQLTSRFPSTERFGLVGQMRRSAVSIPSNIAEGAGGLSSGEFAYYLNVASGSANELHDQLLVSTDLGYLKSGDGERLRNRVESVRRMLFSLSTKIRTSH